MAGLEYKVEITGADKARAALQNVPKNLREATVPVMQGFAKDVQAGAKSRMSANRHPSGLWRNSKGRLLSPSYQYKARGRYWYQVRVPGGDVGHAEAISEFARDGHTPQGRSLVSTLNANLGGKTGRVLWATYDEGLDRFLSDIDEAVAKAAQETEKELDGQG